MQAPLVSVAIANFNGARFLEEAIRSALRQDLQDLEVIVVDDASSDDSVSIVRSMAQQDARIRLESLAWNRGPGAARNRALELARGEWFAVLDGDDLMHPSRLSRLVDLARRDGADVVADDLLVFDDANPLLTREFLRGRRARAPSWVTAEDFLLETRLFARSPNLGYLKPVIRLQPWRDAGVRYDEGLSIGEDHDLLLRLLAAGLRCRLDSSIGYFYRKHTSSISHRMSSGALDRMAEADASFRRSLTSPAPSLVRALDRRLASIESAQAFSRAVDALKARRPLAAAAAVARRPKALLLFRMPLAAAFARIGRRKGRPRRTQPASSAGRICFISRQRLVGATNGSSTYLIDIARAARRAGLSPHLIQPSPVALGRWPVLRLRKDMEVFESIAFRGVIRAGRLIIARDPAIYLSALRGAAAKALSRLGAPSAWLNAKPAPYASAAPWTDQDRLFVAQHARGAEILVADYAWQTEGFACALTPGARTAIVMHDLFHRRAALFHQEDAADSVASLSRDEEVRLLARADAIFAIQGAEAAEVSRLLPGSDVVLVPMTAQPRQDPQPGSDGQLLFVGSNTAPNVLGLTWFFERIWPRVRQAASGAELLVAGNVSRALGPPPPGVVYLGVVDSLAPLYARAAVVISLLTTGSGLKIKLIEALAEGKACVVTPVTLQGVEQEVGAAVACEDQPDDFAAAVIALLADPAARTALGARALSAIQGGFSPQRAHADLTAWLARRPGRTAPELGRLEALPAA